MVPAAHLMLTVPVTASPALPPGDSLPDDLRARYRDTIAAARGSGYLKAARYDTARALLEAVQDPESCRRFLRAMTQLMFDHDRGQLWIRELSGDLARPELASLAFDVQPETTELDHITLRRRAGKPSRVEIFYDETIMPQALRIRAAGRTVRWTPEAVIGRMLERVRLSGDRERLYPASILVDTSPGAASLVAGGVRHGPLAGGDRPRSGV